jgi:hypothetical protein
VDQPVWEYLLDSLHDDDSDFAWLAEAGHGGNPEPERLADIQRWLLDWLERGLISVVDTTFRRWTLESGAARAAILEPVNWDFTRERMLPHLVVAWNGTQDELSTFWRELSGDTGATT